MGQDQLPYLGGVHMPCSRHPRYLVQRSRRAHVRIQSTPRCGHQVHGNAQRIVGIGGLQGVDTQAV